MDIDNILAKSTKNGGTILTQHLLNVGCVCKHMANILGLSEDDKNILIMCGLLHDITKCFSNYQELFNGNENDEDNLRHNVTAWALLSNKTILINEEKVDINKVIKPILFHHSINDEYNNTTPETIIDQIKEENIENIKTFNSLIEEIVLIAKNKFDINLLIKDSENINTNELPHYYESLNSKNILSPLTRNSRLALYRLCLVSADRYASKAESEGVECNEDYINQFINSNVFYQDIAPNFPDFDTIRFANQKDFAIKSAKEHTSIITAPAGYGKTLLGLLWNNQLNNGKKLYWIAPINAIARNCYISLKRELEEFGFDKNITIGLLIANKFEEGDDNSDIIVTNIDNWLRPTFKGDKEINSFELLYSNVVFDEFHMLLSSDPYFSAFILYMNCRNKLCKKSNTLLLSATPNKLINEYWDVDSCRSAVFNCDSQISNQKYKFTFNGKLPSNKNCLVLKNAIKSSQISYYNEYDKDNNALIHSSFIDSDYENKLNDLLLIHGKKNIKDNKITLNTVVGTRCISTSLDISFKNGSESICSPEYTLQFVGRLGRFGEYIDDIISVNVTNETHDKNGSERGAVRILYDTKLTDLWYSFLIDKIHGNIITNKGLYQIYNEFYEKYHKDIQRLIEQKLITSFNSLVNMNYTVGEGNGKSKNKIRGNNNNTIFIYPLDNDSDKEFIKEPLSIEIYSIEESEDIANIKQEKQFKTICNYINSHDLAKKYFNTKEIYVKDALNRINAKVNLMVRKARDRETPLFLTSRRYNEKYGLYDNIVENFIFNID